MENHAHVICDFSLKIMIIIVVIDFSKYQNYKLTYKFFIRFVLNPLWWIISGLKPYLIFSSFLANVFFLMFIPFFDFKTDDVQFDYVSDDIKAF